MGLTAKILPQFTSVLLNWVIILPGKNALCACYTAKPERTVAYAQVPLALGLSGNSKAGQKN